MNNQEISNSLLDTIRKSDFEGLATDFSELAFDQLSELEGVAKDVPVIGSIIKFIRLGFTVKDILFLKKLGIFLWNLKDIPLNERIKLIDKLERDSDYKTDVGGKIMLLLERVDDFEKPQIIANAFKAYLYDKISYNQLQKINFAIDHLFIGDIKEFNTFYNNAAHAMDESTHQNLALCGFATLIQLLDGGTNLKISDFGIVFAENVLEYKTNL